MEHLTIADKKYAGLKNASGRSSNENNIILNGKVLGILTFDEHTRFLLWEGQVYEIKNRGILAHWTEHEFQRKLLRLEIAFKPLPGTVYPGK